MLQNILIVDDNDSYRDLLRGIFEKANHTVTDAESGESALTKLRAGYTPDAAIVDLHMPSMDGIQLIKEMRKGLAILIFLCTSDEKAESLAAGIPNLIVVEKTIEGIRSILEALS